MTDPISYTFLAGLWEEAKQLNDTLDKIKKEYGQPGAFPHLGGFVKNVPQLEEERKRKVAEAEAAAAAAVKRAQEAQTAYDAQNSKGSEPSEPSGISGTSEGTQPNAFSQFANFVKNIPLPSLKDAASAALPQFAPIIAAALRPKEGVQPFHNPVVPTASGGERVMGLDMPEKVVGLSGPEQLALDAQLAYIDARAAYNYHN